MLEERSAGHLSLSLMHIQSDPHSYLLQSVVELHRLQQEALLTPQGGADLLAHFPQLAALRPNGVLGIVGIFYQPVTFTGQGQGAVQYVLLKHIEDVFNIRIYFRTRVE